MDILLSNLLIALGQILKIILGLYYFILIAYVIMSWVSANPYNPLVRFVQGTVEPLLRPIRQRIPPFGMLDLSPLIAFAMIIALDTIVANSLLQFGARLALNAGSGIIGM